MRETYIIPLTGYDAGNDKFLVYRPLLKLAFIGNRAMVERALQMAHSPENVPPDLDLNDPSTKFLVDLGFCQPDVLPTETNPLFTTATLLVTNRCQLRCFYCYAAGGKYEPRVLEWDSAKIIIDTICANAMQLGKKEFRLDFHGGGEPTLEWNLIQQAVMYARAKPIRARISVTSNAIWSEEECRWLMTNLDSMSISTDGDQVTQNHNRPMASGKPSFDIVARNIKMLDEHGFRYGIRMTVVEPWEHLEEDIRYLAKNTRCKSIQAEPAFHPIRGQHGKDPADEEIKRFIEAFKAAYLVAREHQIYLRYSGARPGTITQCFCSAPYEALVVNPENQIVACYEVTDLQHALIQVSHFGSIENGIIHHDMAARYQLHQLMKERLDHCGDCFCRWNCAGDCYARTFEPGEQGHLVMGYRCTINRELTTFLLLTLISEGSGIWQGNQPRKEIQDFPYG